LDLKLTNVSGHSSPYLFAAQPYPALDDTTNLSSQKTFELIERVLTDLKAVKAIITPTHYHLVETGML
jgi:hypothetical protein